MSRQEEREKMLQKRYDDLIREKEDLEKERTAQRLARIRSANGIE